MSTLTNCLIPAARAKRQLEQIAGRRLPKPTLRRWRESAGVELVEIDGKFFYTARDLAKCGYIARYLQDDRNLSRAVISLFEDFSPCH
jgi:hypothetical protein